MLKRLKTGLCQLPDITKQTNNVILQVTVHSGCLANTSSSCDVHCGSIKCPAPYSYDCSFYKCWLSTHRIELICNIKAIDLPTSPAYCCYTTLGNINCCFGQSHLRMYKTLCPTFVIRLNLWPPNSPDVNPVDYQIWSMMQDRLYQMLLWDATNMKQHLIDTALWAMLLMNGRGDFMPVWMKREDILNTCCSKWTWAWTGCADKLDVVLDCATAKCNLWLIGLKVIIMHVTCVPR